MLEADTAIWVWVEHFQQYQNGQCTCDAMQCPCTFCKPQATTQALPTSLRTPKDSILKQARAGTSSCNPTSKWMGYMHHWGCGERVAKAIPKGNAFLGHPLGNKYQTYGVMQCVPCHYHAAKRRHATHRLRTSNHNETHSIPHTQGLSAWFMYSFMVSFPWIRHIHIIHSIAFVPMTVQWSMIITHAHSTTMATLLFAGHLGIKITKSDISTHKRLVSSCTFK